jgi:type II secretory pathway component GspD/PulD (secretin)
LNAGFVAGDFSAVYSALIETGHCRIESNPVLCCSEGESASISFGEKRPFVTGSTIIDENEVPITATRELVTTVSCHSGDAIVLGGLKKVEEQTEYAVPLLSSVPIVGRLFRSKTEETREVELCIMLRPTVMK